MAGGDGAESFASLSKHLSSPLLSTWEAQGIKFPARAPPRLGSEECSFLTIVSDHRTHERVIRR